MQTIKVMPFLQRKGNRLAKAAIEFTSGPLAGFQMVGFTVCEDREKKLSVMFPSAKREGEGNRQYFFLRPSSPEQLDKLQDAILDVYETMTSFNSPKIRSEVK